MTKQFKITDKHRWKMVDAHMSRPIPLSEADLSKPFVYQRGFGVSYVGFGFHPTAMALLYAFNHGYFSGVRVCDKLNLDYPYGASDAWLVSPGTAYLSSVGKNIIYNNINVFEERYFN